MLSSVPERRSSRRAVNDFYHLREKEKTIHTKCKGLVLQKEKCVKEHFDWIMYTLTNIRFAPWPDVFSHLWQGFLSRLIAQGEDEVAKYMYKEVSCIMPGEALALPDEPWPIALEATGQYFRAALVRWVLGRNRVREPTN